jgi:hypothetical protein
MRSLANKKASFSPVQTAQLRAHDPSARNNLTSKTPTVQQPPSPADLFFPIITFVE